MAITSDVMVQATGVAVRRLSRLELSNPAGVSTRHVSFVENARFSSPRLCWFPR